MSATTNTAITMQSQQQSLLESFARSVKAFFQPGQKNAAAWVEISPYGFVSRNYINYIAANFSGCSLSVLPDGSNVLKFSNGGMIVRAASGHIVELDRRRRVILVRVTKSEAEDAKLAMGSNDEPCESFQVSINESGRSLAIMPGNIVILEDRQKVTITFANGSEYFAKKPAV